MLTLALFLTSSSNAQQIDVYGNGNLINDNGTNSPSLINLTNFGSTNESAGVITKIFTITNNALLINLTVGSITIGGPNAADFSVVTQPASPVGFLGGSTTFSISFNPTALGLRTATVSFSTNVGGKNPYNFNISGTGTSFPSQSYTLYYENFDANNDGWTTATSGGSTWTHTTTPFNGEGSYWRLGNNYANNTSSVLISPTINTTGYNNIRVSLDLRVGTNDSDDGMQIQYSTNGGFTWNVLGNYQESVTWYSNTNVTTLGGGSYSLGSQRGFSGTINTGVAGFNDFVERSTQTNDLDNKNNIVFRVLFKSDGSTNSSGVAIDNFFVKGDPLTPFTTNPFNPGNVGTNLKLWLKANAGTSTTTDGVALSQWDDQAIDNDAIGIGATRPIFRDGTRNINFNPIIDFTIANATSMRGKGGFHAQDYFVVVKSNNTIDSASPTRQAPLSGRTSVSSFHLDGTAFALGNFTARYKDELVSHSISSVPQAPSTNSYGRAYATTTETYVQETTIYNVKTNAAGTSTEIYKNGKRIDNYAGESVGVDQVTVTGILNFSEFNNIQYNLGTGRFSLNGNISSYLDGKLAEIISYSEVKSDTEKKKIESYLAIKNGVTLHASNSITATNLGDTDYLDSSGAVTWSTLANTGFNYDIAGIGRDDNTQLNQKQSKSENPNTVLTIGLGDITATNNLNPNNFSTDRNFLVWGSNGANMNNSGVNLAIDLGPTTITTITEVVNRRWKVNEVNGDVATTRVAVPTSAFTSGLPALGPTDAYVMVVATNAAFTTGLETVFMSTVGSNETCLYDFDGTKYITFGVAHRAVNPLHITLDGFDDFVRIDNVNELPANFTVMTWVRPNGANTLGNERTILSKKASPTNGYQIVLQNDNRVRFEWYNGGGTLRTAITTTALPNGIWHNIAYTYSANTLSIYIDGVLEKTAAMNGAPGTSSGMFSIGGQYINKTTINNLFRGDIDELRMWSRVLTATEIRFILNQEILQNGTGTIGTVIPSTVTKNDISGLLWNNLFAYYSMNSYIGTHLDDDSINVNRGSLVIPDKISINPQTAPMPYESNTNGSWALNSVWRSGTIQDVPYSLSIINGTTPIAWNIVRTDHNVTSNGNKELFGLLVDANTISATNNSKIEISHYLKLDGKIDLVDRSQLVQVTNSDLDPTSAGSIERDQQGTKNVFNYNYWSSPVGAMNSTTNNNAYTVSGVMKDGTTTTPQNITWTSALSGSPTNPITLSSYWIFKFQNLTPMYANWTSVGTTGLLNAGQGYTLKGSGAMGATQNYTFVGKPNNGTITSAIAPNNLNLSGNPYASAIDATQFLTDNAASTTGTIYFWEHAPNNTTHVTSGYQGGYSARNLTGGVPPVAPSGITGLGMSVKIPNRYIPVGQGFFITGSSAGGTITFNNGQRLFVKEDNASSNYMFRNNATATVAVDHFNNNIEDEVAEDTFKKVRLGYKSADNFYKQALLGFMESNATEGIDFGYDAVNIDSQANDLYFITNNVNLNIQGVGNFNQNAIYPIGIKNNVAGNVTFQIDEILNFDNSFQAFIHDNLTGIYHNVRNVPAVINVPQGTINNRFSLRFLNNSTALGNESFDLSNGILVAYTNTNSILNIKNYVVDTTVESVALFNLLGQAVGTWDVENQNQQDIQLPISKLSTGTYIVKVITDKGDTSRKIIIK